MLAHPSARPDVLRTALIRGAFDYQGQKCSAASRAFIPRSVWQSMGDDFLGATEALRYGDVTDLSNYGGALIDDRAFAKNVKAIERAKGARVRSPLAANTTTAKAISCAPRCCCPTTPTTSRSAPSTSGRSCRCMSIPMTNYDRILDVIDNGSKYALTGAVIADDRNAVLQAQNRLRYAAGNFYVNDKPTGAVVGQQPFGGSRASGTNDKAGSPLNLLRWTSARSIKETFVPPTDHDYPHMGLTMGDLRHRGAPDDLGGQPAGRATACREGLPVTREVVHRFVPGETVADAMNSVEQLRDSAGAWSASTIRRGRHRGRLRERDGQRLTWSYSTRSAATASPPSRRAATGGVAEAFGARSGVAARRREDRAGERAHDL